jgi:uncharacterized protein
MDGVLIAMALLGLASGVHCVGMCGGIVSAFSMGRVIPIRPAAREWPRQLAFNLGRITSYVAAGALAGAIGSTGALVAGALPLQEVLLVLANLVLILAGLQLAGVGTWLSHIERLGAPLWRRLQPLAARLLASRTLAQVYAAGVAWGWLPCGLVYGALAAAAAYSSTTHAAADGALAMAAFGLGTLPNLMAAGLAAARVRAWLGKRAVRVTAGTTIVAFGSFGLAHAGGIPQTIQRTLLCL